MPITTTTLGRALTLRNLHPVVLDLALFRVFGPEWITWDPDSTEMALNKKVSPKKISRATREKIRGLSVIHSNYLYWEDWRTFEAVSWALNGASIDLRIANPLKAIPLCYAIRAAKWLSAPHEFDDEVKAYIMAVMFHEQLSVLPRDVSWLQEEYLERYPSAAERYDDVKEALSKGVPDDVFSDTVEDPIVVEVARHRVINTVLNILSSKSLLMEQAKPLGLITDLKKVIGGK